MPLRDITPDALPAGPTAGRAANSPASNAADLFVITDDGLRWGPVPWLPRGSSRPVSGDTVLLLFDQNGNAWSAGWSHP